jgi:hypothetical protein
VEATKKEQREVDLELARIGAIMDRLKQRKKDLPAEVKKHEGRKKRAEADVKAGEELVRNYYYNPDDIEDAESNDKSYEQEQEQEQTATHGGRTPSEHLSRSAESARRWRESARQKRGVDDDVVSYQDGRSSGNRSIPSSSRRSIHSRISQHKESELQARTQLYEQQVVQPLMASGFEGEDVYGNAERYDHFSQQMREGNLGGGAGGGGAGGGSAQISRSGGKQRQVVREVKTGTFTKDENPKLVEAIRMYYKEIDEDSPRKWSLLANFMNRTNDSVRHHITRVKGNHQYMMKLVDARKKEVQDAADAQRAKYLADQMIQLQQAQQQHQAQVAARQPRMMEQIASAAGSAVNSLIGGK